MALKPLLGLASDPYLSSLDAGLSSQPLAHWTFNDQTGTVLADRAGSLHGTYTNGPTLKIAGLQPNTNRKAVRFTAASSQWAGVTHDASFALTAGALVGWTRPRGLATAQPVVSKSGTSPAAGDLDITVETDGAVQLTIYDGAAPQVIASPDGYAAVGQIVEFAVVFSAAGFEFWLDGNRIGDEITSYTAGLSANTRNWRFARAGASDVVFGDVDLDDILLLDTVPTAGDLLLLTQMQAE